MRFLLLQHLRDRNQPQLIQDAKTLYRIRHQLINLKSSKPRKLELEHIYVFDNRSLNGIHKLFAIWHLPLLSRQFRRDAGIPWRVLSTWTDIHVHGGPIRLIL